MIHPKNWQPKTETNPKGAGRPRKDAPPPPPPPNEDPRDKELREKAEQFKALKMTPTLAREIGGMLTDMEVTFYGVLARVMNDDRWNLQPDEVKAQRDVLSLGTLVYGELALDALVPIVVVSGLLGPLIARVILLPKKDKSSGGAPVAKMVPKS